MDVTLSCHRDTPSGVASIHVAIEASAEGRLWLRYHVDALLRNIGLPDPAPSARADELWRSTCFELFARRSGRPDYLEFNFSPSSQWAAYRFAGYRDGMSELELAESPAIGLDASEGHLALEVALDFPCEWRDASLHVGLSAVIEETDGIKSYWALKHPADKPDFHHPDGFVLELPPA